MTTQEQIDDAKAKLHLLMTGRLSVEVVADGYLVKYTRADVQLLIAYIASLEDLLAGNKPAGAVGVIW